MPRTSDGCGCNELERYKGLGQYFTASHRIEEGRVVYLAALLSRPSGTVLPLKITSLTPGKSTVAGGDTLLAIREAYAAVLEGLDKLRVTDAL